MRIGTLKDEDTLNDFFVENVTCVFSIGMIIIALNLRSNPRRMRNQEM